MAAPSAALKTWFMQRSLPMRAVISVVAVFVVANLALQMGGSLIGGSQPGGPSGSSYATQGSGLAGWAELLEQNGHRVEQVTEPLEAVSFEPGSTIVVADAAYLSIEDASALDRIARQGSRVIGIGMSSDQLISGVTLRASHEEDDGYFDVTGDAPEVAGLRRIGSDDDLTFSVLKAGPEVLIGDSTRALVIADAVGTGRIVLVASSTVFDNKHLADYDNAALGLQVVGAGPVYFLESFHGYGDASSGWSALPERWRTALLACLACVLLALWSLGKRFGPIEDAVRPLPPPRHQYVDALASGMMSGHDPRDVVGPIQTDLRRRLRKRTGLAATADDMTLAQAAQVTGVPADDVLVALSTPGDDAHLVAVCQAAARVRAFDESGMSDHRTGALP